MKWCADPFIIIKDNKHYVFAECASLFSLKGSIYYLCLEDKKRRWRKAIDENFHLSFPFLFKKNDDYYIMPESCSNLDLRLYKANSFPFDWKLEKVLISSVHFVDSQIYKDFIVTYNSGLEFYSISDTEIKLVNHFADKENILRPAGNFFIKNNKLFLPTQINTNFYGEKILLNEIEFNKNQIMIKSQFEFKEINQLVSCFRKNGAIGIHTYNCLEDFEAIDILCKKISIVAIFGRLIKKIRRSK